MIQIRIRNRRDSEKKQYTTPPRWIGSTRNNNIDLLCYPQAIAMHYALSTVVPMFHTCLIVSEVIVIVPSSRHAYQFPDLGITSALPLNRPE